MFKIGISKCVPMRVANFGKRVELVTVLWGANRHVESWLHDMFADGRVPAHTEWFWATHGPRGIGSYDREFIRDGCLWEDPT
jgi:hypothetical protein